MDCSEVNGFHFPEIVYLRDEDIKDEDGEKAEFLSPNDLLLLSKEKVNGQKKLSLIYTEFEKRNRETKWGNRTSI